MNRDRTDDGPTPPLEAAASPSWSVRAAAGRRLAATAPATGAAPEAAEALLRLLLDPHDTFVTQETAEALLERRDAWGLRMVLAALAAADDDAADHLGDAVDNVCRQSEDDAERLAALCSELASDADAAVRKEAGLLLATLR
ncbi:HEAT repeat domain-containing protein [Streptomyces sp. URMC 123]|uniref:HEAT repeat domain-containing protein n=1 Tax=Streptomyces sp. URMC 123 TaxID=3423403 RepID=UPI003F1943EB